MRLNSIRARLIFGATLWICVGLGGGGLILAELFRDLAIAQYDHDLSDHLEELKNLTGIDSNATPYVRQPLSDSRFSPLQSGLYWQIWHDNRTARSPSLGTLDLPNIGRENVQKPRRVEGPRGPMRMVQKVARVEQSYQPVQLAVAVDENLVNDLMHPLYVTLAFSLGVLGLGLFGAAFAQVKFGLHPLTRIRNALNAVRENSSEQLPVDVPLELFPLVRDLNVLILANRDMVRRARQQAATFAHALKTPLTILMDEGRRLAEAGQHSVAQTILDQCSRLQQQIDYQTARARIGGRTNPGAITVVAQAIGDVTIAISQLYQARHLAFEIVGPKDTAITCDHPDLSEMMGNLIDNAAKWASSAVRITIEERDNVVRISVEDDGPGIPTEHFETVFDVGARLDEQTPGSGLGLAITRDLVTLYGGRVWIERSNLGGVAACLELASFQ